MSRRSIPLVAPVGNSSFKKRDYSGEGEASPTLQPLCVFRYPLSGGKPHKTRTADAHRYSVEKSAFICV
jgi:hypothetical protein